MTHRICTVPKVYHVLAKKIKLPADFGVLILSFVTGEKAIQMCYTLLTRYTLTRYTLLRLYTLSRLSPNQVRTRFVLWIFLASVIELAQMLAACHFCPLVATEAGSFATYVLTIHSDSNSSGA